MSVKRFLMLLDVFKLLPTCKIREIIVPVAIVVFPMTNEYLVQTEGGYLKWKVSSN